MAQLTDKETEAPTSDRTVTALSVRQDLNPRGLAPEPSLNKVGPTPATPSEDSGRSGFSLPDSLTLSQWLRLSEPQFPLLGEGDERTPRGAVQTQEVKLKCRSRGASGPSRPAASLAFPGLGMSPAPTLPGTFSLCPTPICMPSCQHWQVSQARLPPSPSCVRWWGKGLEPGAVLVGDGQGLGLGESGPWTQEFWKRGEASSSHSSSPLPQPSLSERV